MTENMQMYMENGVVVSKIPMNVGDEITLSYNGLLVASGADKVFANIMYEEDQEKEIFIAMDCQDGFFKGTFTINCSGNIKIAFKDSANNWDNNSSNYYTFKVVAKKVKSAVKKEKAVEIEAEPVKKPAKARAKKTIKE